MLALHSCCHARLKAIGAFVREWGGAKTLCNRDGTFAWGDGRQNVREGTFVKGDGGQNVREGTFAKGDGGLQVRVLDWSSKVKPVTVGEPA